MRGAHVKLKCAQVYGFLRRLLANEEFGKLFTSFEICWGKNHSGSRNRKWSEAELAKIRSIGDTHGGFEEPWKEIIENLTATREPLFIPVLCLLPNLKHLNLGEICGPGPDQRYEKAEGRLFIQDYMRIWFKNFDLQADHEQLFKSFPAGLVNLRSFSVNCSEMSTKLIEESYLELILILPNIEKVNIEDLETDFSVLQRFNEAGLKSKVKTIFFKDCRCDSDELVKFIECCDALESFIVYIVDYSEETSGEYNGYYMQPLGPMKKALLKHHKAKETLKYASIASGGRSWNFELEDGDGVPGESSKPRVVEKKGKMHWDSNEEGETWVQSDDEYGW
ncbi:hypothetical protein ABW20_dc0107848 [Dactylellina cionopaga]|nr:hypothetical protein ABW20_dc0107848 [Dactylellina cionopaga]